MVRELSDTLEGPGLATFWQSDLHEGRSSVGIWDGRLYVQGAHYGYAHVRREFGRDNVAVQCLILRADTGCADAWGGSLVLGWANGEFVQATPGTCEGRFLYVVSGVGTYRGQAIGRNVVPGWYPYYPNWVKISLQPEVLAFYSSADGRNWVKDQEVKRGEKHAGAPQYLLLGNGGPGERPHFDNVLSQHFDPQSPSCTFFSDLRVGTTE
jgi:hypothetical protein